MIVWYNIPMSIYRCLVFDGIETARFQNVKSEGVVPAAKYFDLYTSILEKEIPDVLDRQLSPQCN